MGVKLIAIMGLPSCGKTTVGKTLAKQICVQFLGEIAEKIVDMGYEPGLHASTEFDERILRLEKKRDEDLLKSGFKSVIVESWHLANYAYSLTRGSPTSKKYKAALTKAIERFDVLCLLFKISPGLSIYRCQELSWPKRIYLKKAQFHEINFLRNLDKNFDEVLQEYKIRTITIDASKPIIEVTEAAIFHASEFLQTTELATIPQTGG
jgi:thymidylate kinase